VDSENQPSGTERTRTTFGWICLIEHFCESVLWQSLDRYHVRD